MTHPEARKKLLAYARELRRNMSDAERLLWSVLRDRRLGGVKFRRQVPKAPFIADFIRHQRRLIVEVDGGQHTEARDRGRTRFLNERGFLVLRFWNPDVLLNLEGVCDTIWHHLERRAA